MERAGKLLENFFGPALMKTALFSDIHSNLEALEAAVGHAEKSGIRRFAVLGDTIGYGANPNECFEWVLKHADVLLIGNHEKALTDPVVRYCFSGVAGTALDWTERKMDKKLIAKTKEMDLVKIEGETTFAHSSPDRPDQFRYIWKAEDARPSFSEMKTQVCFVGHTHVPACFFENGDGGKLKPGVIKLPEHEKMILNPGSVGQPRDEDPRLSYGIFDEEARTFEIVRLEYDNRKAAEKIRKAGLPAYLADRLL